MAQKSSSSPVVTQFLSTTMSPIMALTDNQRVFCEQTVKGNSPSVAARIAGYINPKVAAVGLIRNDKIQAAVRYLYKEHAKAADMSRKKVMDGFLEAIDMARIQADSGNMVAGWREIAKMCGYYAPEVHKIDVTVTAKRVIDRLETMSDADLLEMVNENAQIIEGSASVLLESADEDTALDQAALDAELGLQAQGPTEGLKEQAQAQDSPLGRAETRA